MKAVAFDEFGGPEVLHLADVPIADPGEGQVRVKVSAAGVNPFDGKVRAGAMEQQFRTNLPKVLGIELAGVVDALGDGVTDVQVGDRVFGWADGAVGSYAELALSKIFARIPDGLADTAAVSLPVAAETALRVLDALDLKAGETLLLHGASGSVGELATQFAVKRGATVIGTASPENQAKVRSLGATPTTYGAGLVERVRAVAPQGVDAVFDAAGKGALADSVELRGGSDRIVTIADPAAFAMGITFSSGGDPAAVDLAGLAAQLAAGELTISIGGSYAFAEAAKAHKASDSGHAGGKVVLVP